MSMFGARDYSKAPPPKAAPRQSVEARAGIERKGALMMLVRDCFLLLVVLVVLVVLVLLAVLVVLVVLLVLVLLPLLLPLPVALVVLLPVLLLPLLLVLLLPVLLLILPRSYSAQPISENSSNDVKFMTLIGVVVAIGAVVAVVLILTL